MAAARIACLLVSELPLHAELRAHPELRGAPVAIATGPGSRAELCALSPEARAAGVRRFGSAAQALAACPELRLRLASPVLEQAARDTLLDLALSFSPRAQLAPRATGLFAAEGAVFLDASGMARLFPSESGFASALADRAGRQGLPGAVSVASSKTIALLVARRICSEPGATLALDPDREREWLAPLSLDLLDPDDRLAAALTRLGVQTVAELLRLPRRALAGRLGPEVIELIAKARGEHVESPLPEPRETTICEAIDLEHSITRLEPLGFVLRGLLSRLLERLALRALSCGPLRLELRLEGGGRDVRQISLAAPTSDVRVLLRLANLALAEHPPSAPIESLSLRTEGRPRRTDQIDFFRPHGPDPTALEQTLSRLEALCGEGRVGSPRVRDRHDPTDFELHPFEPPPPRDAHARAQGAPRVDGKEKAPANPPDRPGGPGSLFEGAELPALRALRPSIAARVRVARGQPVHVQSALTQGDVVVASGPWRSTGHWWSETERYAKDHFDVQMNDGLVIRLCFDWVKRVWQIDGVYD